MIQKILATFAILALSAAFAGTVPAPGAAYKVTLTQPSVVNGTQLKPGDYKLKITPDKITIGSGKDVFDVKAKVETADQKFPATALRYVQSGGKATVAEIRIGGTTTKLVLE